MRSIQEVSPIIRGQIEKILERKDFGEKKVPEIKIINYSLHYSLRDPGQEPALNSKTAQLKRLLRMRDQMVNEPENQINSRAVNRAIFELYDELTRGTGIEDDFSSMISIREVDEKAREQISKILEKNQDY